MNKKIEIEIPEGKVAEWQEIEGKMCLVMVDEPKQNARPMSWEEYCKNEKGKFVLNSGALNGFRIREEANAFLALGKLIQLRDAWVGDWKPNCESNESKYVIHCFRGKVSTNFFSKYNATLAFPTEEMRDEFLDTFRDLIEEAKMFI